MTLSRRDLLRSTGLLAGGSLLAAEAARAAAGAVSSAAPTVVGTIEPADIFDYAKVAPDHM